MKKHKVIKHSYAELFRVGSKYYADKNFCAVIATAVINDWSFGISKAKLESRGYRTTGKGVYPKDSHSLFAEHGKKLEELPRGLHGKTLRTFSQRAFILTGRYIIHTKGHITAVRDGIMEDSPGAHRSLKPILGLFKVVDAS